ALRTTEGWELQRDSDGIKTMYKHDPSTPHIHCLRIEGMVDCPVFDLLALLNEVQFYPEWIPSYRYLGLTMAEKVVNPRPTQMLNHLKVAVPWPIANRECLFSVDAIDCIGKYEDPRQLIILLKSESGMSYEPLVKEEDMPVPDRGAVVCDILEPSGIVLTPCEDGRTFVQMVEHLDPHISYIPGWLLDLVVRNMCYMILARVRSAVEIVKKPCYQERMRDPNNAFYMYIRMRIEEDMPEEMKYVIWIGLLCVIVANNTAYWLSTTSVGMMSVRYASFTTAWSSLPSDEEEEEEFTNDLYVEVEHLLRDIAEDRVVKAGRRLAHIRSICKGQLPHDLLAKMDANSKAIISMEERTIRVKKVRIALTNDDGWQLQRDSKGIKTYYKHNKDTPNLHSLRIEGVIDCPLFDLMALLSEVDFYKDWIPSYKFLGIRESKKVAAPKATQMLLHIVAALPWPFDNRDLVISVDGIDCIGPYEDPRQIVILLKSESGSSYEPYVPASEMPGPAGGSTACDVLGDSGATLTPLGDGKTFLQVVMHIDPHICFVPDWLIDIAARSFCYLMLTQVRSAVEIVKKPCYQERMRDPNNAFYMYTRRRIEEDMPEEMKYAGLHIVLGPAPLQLENFEASVFACPECSMRCMVPLEASFVTACSSIMGDDDLELDHDVYAEFDSLLEDINADRIARAGRRLARIESWAGGKLPDGLHARYVENFQLIDRTRTRWQRMERLRSELRTDDGWELQRCSNGIRTLYQHNGESPSIHSLRVEGTIDSPMFDLLALLNEVGFYTQWLPSLRFLGLTKSIKIANPTPTQMLVHMKATVPWPFKNRESVFSVDGIDCMGACDDPRQIVILLKSEAGSSYEPYVAASDIPQLEEDSVPCDILNNSGLVLTPCGNGTTFMQCIVHLDPHLSFAPDWLIDLVARNFCFLIIEKVRSAVEIVKKPCYQERMRDPNNAFYMYIRMRIEEDMPEEMKYLPPLNMNIDRRDAEVVM
ncbi:hypothetical protein FOZ63_010765, partial [Perkinsus olseni]